MPDAFLGDAYAVEPDYSPDGAWIAYSEYGGTRNGIWLLERSTGARSMLTSGNGDQRPVWSPDGTMVLFIRDGRPHVVDVATGAVTRLARQEVAAAAWTW
jgi:Tol biopolymer transport system component